jgi:hypothetical protein
MRKVLIVVFGFASLVAIASVQPAAAKHVRCETHIFGQSRSGPNIQNSGWTIFPGELQQCFWVEDGPPKPTTPWQGSASGVNKAFNPSTAYKNK